MTSNRIVIPFTLPLMLLACVTVNIYFPAAAAEKAADRIIEDVLGKQAEGKKKSPEQTPAPKMPEKPPTQDKSSQYHGSSHNLFAADLLNIIIAPAQAAEADLNIATPAIDALRASMKARNTALAPYYDSGVIGFSANGLVAERDPSATPLKDRNAVKRLVPEENADRAALYREIASANGHPEWEADIRNTFAKRWVENAAPGWWYQDGSGAWKQK